ncbi:GGDEF domain-containing protein [Aquihabitans sp. G128]|uniref:GGDEF domain-containing protein n=1 Tax=Aquihabitans sp. G128 TaxID=2849779 RepID=UPI001C217919|nr:GGDEF domain-containing protein [Aquihabitans sp. G128]QXC60671.1 GGDEF domain-containing protein [Aquihabitans sp. G128]
MRASAVEREREVWRVYARTGHVLNLVIVVIDTAYVVATWGTGPHRLFLLWLNLFAMLGLVAAIAVVPEVKLAASPNRDLIFAAWITWGTVLITVAASADGGLVSPMVWLLPLSVMFTAVAHRATVVAFSGGLALAGYLLLAATDGSGFAPAPAGLHAVYLLALTYAAVSATRSRWTHHDEQVVLHEELAHLADRDGLTGLLNHRAFHEQLAARLDRCNVDRLAATVLLVDLDHFKGINDRLGHQVGDEVLRTVALAITSAVHDRDLVGRVGGEEFAVYLGTVPPAEAHEIAEGIRTTIARIEDPEPLTASIGAATSRDGLAVANDLLAWADEAMYVAKRQGRNRTCWLRAA